MENPANIWSPTWVHQNYKLRNPDPTLEHPVQLQTNIAEERDTSEAQKEPTKKRQRTEDDGEPPDEAIEEDQTASLDPWTSTHREKWQRHSELGPNLAPVGNSTAPKPWMPNINPPEFDWCSRWPDIDVETLRANLNRWRPTEI